MMQDHMNIEGLLGAYALDAVEENERRMVEQHLDACPRCRSEVREHREIAAILGGDSVRTSSRVWQRIQAELSAGVPDDDPAPVVPLPSRWNRIGGWATAVAASVIIALAAGLFVQSGRIGDLTARLSDQDARIAQLAGDLEIDPLQQAVTAALQRPDALVATLSSPEDGDASLLIVILPDGTGFTFQNALSELSADRTYQLWAVVDGRAISAGVLGTRPDLVPFHIDPAGLEGLVITEEVAGGVEKSGNQAVVAWFDA